VDGTGLTRRRLLAGLGTLSAAVLAGCARPSARSTASSQAQSLAGGLARVAPAAAASPAFAVYQGQYELLVGKGQRVAFGLSTLTNEPISNADLVVRYVAENGQIGAAVKPTFHPGTAAFPLYLAAIDVPAPGIGYVVATTPDGMKGGEFAIKAVDPANSATVPPGQNAISAPTPTLTDPLGVAQICTRRVNASYSPCGMHTDSLDQVLAAGRPVMLSFATPQFCASAMCGPAVDTIESVRTSRDWADLAWIHVEIFRDGEAKTLVDAVNAWTLPSEPWLFAIDRAGTVLARLEGPIIAEELPPLATRLMA
jgi:hypothetical protein